VDLSSLDSVRAFAASVIASLDGALADILVLNAGIHLTSTDRVSQDGFELTFAVNHLSHYLLARLLLPHIADGGRLVITTSDTHDPEVSGMGPKSLVIAELAHPTKTGF